ncbi:hypothetical protein FRB90_006202 [Tulasnella sp. 427]|nr:hypothetical protein FRB90_006202 [Tulasnella sp. 427]
MSSNTPAAHPGGKKRAIGEVETTSATAKKKARPAVVQQLSKRYRDIENFSEAEWETESEAESADYTSDVGIGDEADFGLHWTVQQRLDEMTEILREGRLTHWYLKMIAEGLGTWCRGGRNADIAEGLIGQLEHLALNGSRLKHELDLVKEVCRMSGGGGCAFDREEEFDGGNGSGDDEDDDEDEDDDDSDTDENEGSESIEGSSSDDHN